MFRRLIATTPAWFTLPLRLTLGIIFIAHGLQKVFGYWGGPGLSTWIGRDAPMGLRPAAFWLGAAAFAELVGGLLVLLGLLTRVGGFLIACVMLVAIFGVHWSRGFFAGTGGFEFPLALLGMALALLIAGGGRASIDERLQHGGRRRY